MGPSSDHVGVAVGAGSGDVGWVVCTQMVLEPTWTEADLQDCLATQLGVAPDDPNLLLFLQWAVNEGLIPMADTSTSGGWSGIQFGAVSAASGAGVNLYVDDVAIATSRIGCN